MIAFIVPALGEAGFSQSGSRDGLRAIELRLQHGDLRVDDVGVGRHAGLIALAIDPACSVAAAIPASAASSAADWTQSRTHADESRA